MMTWMFNSATAEELRYSNPSMTNPFDYQKYKENKIGLCKLIATYFQARAIAANLDAANINALVASRQSK